MKVHNPELAATTKQTFYIFTLTKTDVRDQNLTRGEAAEMISKLLAEKKCENTDDAVVSEVTKTNSFKGPMGKNGYLSLLKQAKEAANQAGDEWMKAHTNPAYVVKDGDRIVGTMLDVCGFAYIEIRDGRTAFAKWLKANKLANYKFLHVGHKYEMRQELGLKEACEMAALKVLEKGGIKGLGFYSRID